MIEILSYHYMQRALFAGTLIGIVCAIIGTYVVLKGLSFIGAGIAHASFGGVALGFFLKVNPVLTAVIFAVLFAVIYLTLYRWLRPRLGTGLRMETVHLTWNDLRLPGLLFVISVILGLIVIT